MTTAICWYCNLSARELRELDFNVADWYICFQVMDDWYDLYLKENLLWT